MSPRPLTLCTLSLSLSLLGLASTACAQRVDTFEEMRLQTNRTMGLPANTPAPVGLRVTAELFGGAVGGGVGGGVGLLVGGLGCGFDALDSLTTINGTTSSSCHGRLPVAVFGPVFFGAAVGSAFGVTAFGDRMGARGAWWGATLGMLAGSAVGVAIV
jgi:hypothetical protein